MSHRRLDYNLEGVDLGDDTWMNNLPPPPPLPPTPPPLEEKESEPVHEFVVKDGAERLKALEEEARESHYKGFISHLKYSEFDWGISFKEFSAGKCIVKGMDCQITPGAASDIRKHFLTKKHLDWDEKMRKKAEDEANMAVDQPTPPALPMPTNTKRKFGNTFPASDNGEGKLRKPL